MGLKVKDRAKPKLPPVEPGVYIAVQREVQELPKRGAVYLGTGR